MAVQAVGAPTSARVVNLAEEMPEIMEHVPAEQRGLAQRALVARTVTLEKGRWQPSALEPAPGFLGMLVLDGLLTRDVVMHEPLASELVGRGDLLRIDVDGESAPVPFDVAWHVTTPVRLALLDAAFARRIAPWPPVIEFVVQSMTARAHSLAVSMAISRLRHVETRLLVLLWYLAERWGVVRPEGVDVPLDLSHETLGRLIGARRPSVTTALSGLQQEGLISRTPNRHWLLHGDPPETKSRVTATRGGPRSINRHPPADAPD